MVNLLLKRTVVIWLLRLLRDVHETREAVLWASETVVILHSDIAVAVESRLIARLGEIELLEREAETVAKNEDVG